MERFRKSKNYRIMKVKVSKDNIPDINYNDLKFIICYQGNKPTGYIINEYEDWFYSTSICFSMNESESAECLPDLLEKIVDKIDNIEII